MCNTLQAVKTFRATPPSEQIAMLEDQKRALMGEKAQLERKLDLFYERVREREKEKKKKANNAR